MPAWKKNLWILFAGTMVASACYSMVVPFLPLYLGQLGVKHNLGLWSGVIFSSAFFAGAVVAPLWGAMSDRHGRKPMLIRAGITLTVVYCLTAFVTNPWELLVLRILMGALSGYVPSAIALVGSMTPSTSVGFAMSMMSMAGSTGGILGPLLGGVISHWFGYPDSFLVAGIAVLISTVLAIGWVKEEGFVPMHRKIDIASDIRVAVKNRPFLMILITNILVAFSINTIEPLLPLYVVKLGVSQQNASLTTGIVFSVVGLAAIFFSPFWGRMGDRYGFSKILIIGLIGGGLGNIAQVFFGSVLTFGIFRFAYGMFFCSVFPAINAVTAMVTEQEFRGRAYGLSQSANQIGTFVGPLVGGWLGDVFQIHDVFIVTGLMLVVGAVYVLAESSAIRRSSVI